MSIYFHYEVAETGYRFRRAVDGDRHDIELMLSAPHTQPLFGDQNIGSLIELSVLSICMVNEDKRVVGFLALSDHPNVSGVDPADWGYWIRNLYQKYFLSRNTLFVHFMCCIDTVMNIFLEEALISVFLNDSYLLYIVFVVPVFCPEELIMRHGVFKKRNCYKFLPRGIEDRIGNYLVTAGRQDFCPKLRMRRAVEEDNDDVVEILDSTSSRMKELYGLYYISELIGRHPESPRKILVGDIQGRAVSVMCLNTDINFGNLQKIYELKPFNYLSASTPLEKEQHKRANKLLAAFGDPILKGKWHPYQNFDREPYSYHRLGVSEEFEPRRHSSRIITKKLSKVNFQRNSKSHNMTQSLDHIIVKENDSDDLSERIYNNSPTVSHGTLYAVINMLDDDPFDYDIVNIDQKWLKTSSEMRPQSSGFSFKKKWKKNYKKPMTRIKKVSILDEKSSVTHHGIQNAFMIELFALRDDIDERYAFDMLEAAFDFMKDYDYCIIRIPTSESTFPLLQHFCFVPMKNKKSCDYALYVAHRSSVLGKLRVREAEIIDIPNIAKLLYPLEAKETMSAVESMIFNSQENKAYVLTSGMSVVGIGLLELPQEVDFLRGYFNIDAYQLHKYRYECNGFEAGFANIRTIIVYPVFEPHYRFFARELMRLSGNNTLMYVTAYRNKWVVHQGNAIVASMVPLLPRDVEIDSDVVPDLQRLRAMSDAIVPFSAWFINKKFTSLSKVTITTQIVIIGASRTALGFLKALLFDQPSTYLTFTNVTLISTYGLPYMRHPRPVAESMFRIFLSQSEKYLKSVPYTYYVNVIQGKMAEINLQKKFVTLTSGSRYYYDLLFLFFGKQYQHPDYMTHLLEKDRDMQSKSVPEYFNLDEPRYSDIELLITSDDTPENVFIINHTKEARKALDYVKKLSWDGDAKVIVYGANIHAYLCINALLTIEVPPENIIFVEPFPSEDPKKTRVPEFCNEKVDITVKEILQNLKITVYRSYHFVSWTTLDSGNLITHVEFLSHFKYLQLKCCALFYYGKTGIDMRAFVAIHKSGLSYDGGIVIDNECQTRDPAVYAAGPHTRYHRRYYAETSTHKYFDSFEIGHKIYIFLGVFEWVAVWLIFPIQPGRWRCDRVPRDKLRFFQTQECREESLKIPLDTLFRFSLGTRIRNRLDPLFTELPYNPTDFLRRPSEHEKPHGVSFCKQASVSSGSQEQGDFVKPGLMQLRKPRVTYCVLPGGLKYLEVRSPGLKLPHHFVQSLGYNGLVMETFKRGYFKVHLSKDFCVDGITCLGPATCSMGKFQYLYGHSATVLKNVHLRFSTNKVDDFYEFFEAPWAFFLYHDHVEDLFTMSKELFPKNQSTGRTIEEAFCVSLQDSPDVRKTGLKKSPYVEAITEYVIDWLSQNDILLPMYLQPWQCTQFDYDQGNNSLFKAKKDESGQD